MKHISFIIIILPVAHCDTSNIGMSKQNSGFIELHQINNSDCSRIAEGCYVVQSTQAIWSLIKNPNGVFIFKLIGHVNSANISSFTHNDYIIHKGKPIKYTFENIDCDYTLGNGSAELCNGSAGQNDQIKFYNSTSNHCQEAKFNTVEFLVRGYPHWQGVYNCQLSHQLHI